MSIFDEIRAAAREVARRARFVRIDEAGLDALAARMAAGDLDDGDDDPTHHRMSDDTSTIAYVITMDAINFGSGWFPLLRKPDGRSGYFTIATALRRSFESEGPWSTARMCSLDAAACARIFGQDENDAQVGELMGHFASSLRDLGAFLEVHCDGKFEALVETAERRAATLVEQLVQMPLYRDVARYDGFEVPLYKRAQITVADLASAFGRRGPGAFDDLGDLTMFPDNLVPHVLRCEGALAYAPDLLGRIDAGTLIESGSPEEVEIRAVGLHAVEELTARIRASGREVFPHQVDQRLWSYGQRPEIKARNRHRTRTVFY